MHSLVSNAGDFHMESPLWSSSAFAFERVCSIVRLTRRFSSRAKFDQLARIRRAQSFWSGASGDFHSGPATVGRSMVSPVIALNHEAR